jgi:hypothetical protein
MQTTTIDPRIGTLNRNGDTVYYAHLPLSASDEAVTGRKFLYVEDRDVAEVAFWLALHDKQS